MKIANHINLIKQLRAVSDLGLLEAKRVYESVIKDLDIEVTVELPPTFEPKLCDALRENGVTDPKVLVDTIAMIRNLPINEFVGTPDSYVIDETVNSRTADLNSQIRDLTDLLRGSQSREYAYAQDADDLRVERNDLMRQLTELKARITTLEENYRKAYVRLSTASDDIRRILPFVTRSLDAYVTVSNELPVPSTYTNTSYYDDRERLDYDDDLTF